MKNIIFLLLLLLETINGVYYQGQCLINSYRLEVNTTTPMNITTTISTNKWYSVAIYKDCMPYSIYKNSPNDTLDFVINQPNNTNEVYYLQMFPLEYRFSNSCEYDISTKFESQEYGSHTDYYDVEFTYYCIEYIKYAIIIAVGSVLGMLFTFGVIYGIYRKYRVSKKNEEIKKKLLSNNIPNYTHVN
jgi:hypothetical protein